jgi:DNA-binding Lrp family transcriptional regulator
LSGKDELQTRILRELMTPQSSFRWDVNESYSSIARKLRIADDTVRKKLLDAKRLGFWEGWALVLNPHIIGREAASIVLDVGDVANKPAFISQIRLIDGVHTIFNFHGEGVRIELYYTNERELGRKLELIKRICRGKSEVYWTSYFPSSDLKLRRTDWEIIKALRKNPRRRISELAAELELSVRTVKRRLSLMIEGKAFFLLPRSNLRKYPGITCVFLIHCPDQLLKGKNDRLVAQDLEGIVFTHTGSKEYSTFAVVRRNLSEEEEVCHWIFRQPGVHSLRMDVLNEIIQVFDWFDEEIERHLSGV